MNKTELEGEVEKRRAVLVLGAGGWGTALAIALEGSGSDVRIWGRDERYMRRLEESRENPKFLPGIRLAPGIRCGTDVAALSAGANVLFSVIPTQFLRTTLSQLRPQLPDSALLVSCSKGLEAGTLKRPSEILSELWPRGRVVVLSGPSHAEEVSRGLPAAVVAASRADDGARQVQQLLADSHLRVYTTDDPLGVEIGAVAKNIIAIGAGISDGLGLGDNTRAGLITRGLREMTRLGIALGAHPDTFAGLSGLGDLVATCTSEHSRNRAVGFRIGRGERLEDILRSTEKVAEGVESTRAFKQLATQLGVDAPITNEVHAVLFEHKPPKEAVQSLMARESREENR